MKKWTIFLAPDAIWLSNIRLGDYINLLSEIQQNGKRKQYGCHCTGKSYKNWVGNSISCDDNNVVNLLIKYEEYKIYNMTDWLLRAQIIEDILLHEALSVLVTKPSKMAFLVHKNNKIALTPHTEMANVILT